MAKAATACNVHARVFSAKEVAPQWKAPHASKKRDPMETLQREIAEWKASGSSARFWVRDDDATVADPRLIELIELCERESVPLCCAVIPLPMTLELIELISKHPSVTPIQHGFDHGNREPSADKAKSEFPEERDSVEALRSIQLGWYVLSQAFGDRALPVFCPPWGTIAPKFRDRLGDLGFAGFSASRIASELHRQGIEPRGLRLASAHVAVNQPRRDGRNVLPEARILETLASVVRAIRLDGSDEPVGIMTHHWGVDESVRHFLRRLFSATRDAGAQWLSARDLFSAEPVSSTPLVSGSRAATAEAAVASV
jgi:hypothetical protein